VNTEESVAFAVGSLRQDILRLVDAQKSLGRAELDEKVRELKRDAMIAFGGALLVILFSLCLVAAAIFGLSFIVAPWAAALLVGGALGLTGLTALYRFQSHQDSLHAIVRGRVPSKRDLGAGVAATAR
jgi:hypothetical protein